MGQFVLGAGALCFVFDAGQQHQLRKALDETAFAAAHGADHADINIAASTLCNVLINLILCHCSIPFHKAAGISRQVASAVSSWALCPSGMVRWLAVARSLARAW